MKNSRIALFATLLLALCGAMAFAADAVTVIFYTWDDPANMPIIDTFNKSQKEVFVDAKVISSNEYEAKISTLLAGGAEMDGYMQKRTTDYFAHYANGYILPLNDLCKKYKFDLKAISAYIPAISVGNEVVGIPFRGSSHYTYYNKVLFKKAGVPTPETYVKKGQWTWPKFIEVARQIKAKVPDVYGGFLHTWGSSNVMPALQNGVQFVTADGKVQINQSLINSFKYRKQMEKEGLIMPLTESKITKTHYSKPFYAGQAAMLVMGEWFPGFMLKGRDQKLLEGYTWNDWSLTRMPCDEKQYTTFGNPVFNHVNANAKNKEPMFKFIAWMGGPEGAMIIAKAGLMPANITANVKKVFAENLPDKNALSYYTEPRRINTQFYNKYGSKVEAEMIAIMEEYLAADMSDQELQTTLEQRLQKIAEQVQ